MVTRRERRKREGWRERNERGQRQQGDTRREKRILTLPSQCKKGRHRVLHDTWRKVSSKADEFGYHRDTREKTF